MSFDETSYALRLRSLGFALVDDPDFFTFEVKGVLVAPVGRAFAHISSPDHLTMVRDEHGRVYCAHELIPRQHLCGNDVTSLVAEQTAPDAYRRRGRVYVPSKKPSLSPRRKQALPCVTGWYEKETADP